MKQKTIAWVLSLAMLTGAFSVPVHAAEGPLDTGVPVTAAPLETEPEEAPPEELTAEAEMPTLKISPDTGDLVLHYDFETLEGGIIADQSGNGFNGTLVGDTAELVAAGDGSALSLPGSGDYVKIPAGVLAGIEDMTMTGRVYLDKRDNVATLFAAGVAQNSGPFAHLMAAGLNVASYHEGYGYVINGASGSQKRLCAPLETVVETGRWVDFAVTQEGDAVTLYLDGEAVLTQSGVTDTLGDVYVDENTNVYLGRAVWNDPKTYGKFDDFKIYNRALSAEELGGGEESGELALYYDFEALEGGKVPDRSGNGFHGAVLGGTAGLIDAAGGKALSLPGADDYVKIPAGVLKNLQDMTLCGEVFLTQRDDVATLFAAGVPQNSGPFAHLMAAGLNVASYHEGYGYVINGASGSQKRLCAPLETVVDTERWVSFAVTQEGDTVTLYLDGEAVFTQSGVTDTLGEVYVDENTNVYLGRAVWNDPKTYGQLDNFKIYRRALSGEEVAAQAIGPVLRREAAALEVDPRVTFSDIALPQPQFGTSITWSSSDPQWLSDDGKVTRDAEASHDVTLTATIEKDGQSMTKEFVITILQDTPQTTVAYVKANLTLPKATRKNLELPTSGEGGASIAWRSDDTALISGAGEVVRPARGEGNRAATLTATIEKDGYSETKDFPVTVIGLDELAHQYRFDGDASDAISGADGELIGGAQAIDGRLKLNGTDAYLRMPENWIGAAAETGALTISTWVKPTTLTNWQTLFHVSLDKETYLTLAQRGDPNREPCGLVWSWKAGEQRVVAADAADLPQAGVWNHVAATCSDGTVTLYLNGRQVAQADTGLSLAAFAQTANNYIGYNVFEDDLLNASLSNYQIYYRALTADEIAEAAQMEDSTVLMEDADYIRRAVDFLINDGNPLPQPKLGSSVEWSVLEGEAEIQDGALVKNERSAEREPVRLRAVVTKGGESQTLDFDHVTLIDPYVGYILSFFGADGNYDGVTNTAEKFRMAYSYDGFHWAPLNNNQPVVSPTLGTTKRVRDPYVMRNKDGSFSVLATQGWDTPYIYIWQSENLTEFTNERLLRAAQSGVAGLTGSRAWAPEGSYDPITDQYYLYWSDPSASSGSARTGVTYYNTSKDLESLSEPGIYFDPGYRHLDANIIKHDGEYFMDFRHYRTYNDEGTCGIQLAKSQSLAPGSFTVYTEDVNPYRADSASEGSFAFKLNGENKWYLYWDYNDIQKFGVSVTDDLSSGEWTFLGINPNMPHEVVRHGGSIPVTEKELNAIRAKWNGDSEALTVKGAVEAELEVKGNVPFAQLALPETAQLLLSNGKAESFPVVWSEEGYIAGQIGSYTLTGAVTLPGNVTNPSGFQASIVVTVVAESEEPTDVDKTALKALIAAIDGKYEENRYTAASWAALTDALNAAKAVAADTAATQQQVFDAYLELVKARDGLTYAVDTSLLSLAIELAEEALKDESLSSLSKAELQKVVDAAKAALNNADATQAEINAAYTAVMTRITKLVKADKSLLRRLIAAAEALTEGSYRPSSWANLQAVLAEAKAVEANGNATEAMIKAACDKLFEAINGLVNALNYAGINSAIEFAEKILADSKYDEATKAGLAELVEEAKALREKEDATQAELDAKAAELTRAAAKVRLAQAVANANALNAANYTAASWNAMLAVKADAEAVLANENASGPEMTEAATALTSAVKGLVKKSSGSKGTASNVSSDDYWSGVIEKINGSDKGDTISVKLEDGAMMPATVIDAAAAKGVKLEIEIGGKEYLVSSYKIDASAVYYSGTELIAMADGEAKAPATGSQTSNPETGGEAAAAMPNAAAPAGAADSANETIGAQQTAEQGENLSGLWLLVLAAAAISGVSLIAVRKKHKTK